MQYRVIERNDGKAYIQYKRFFWLDYKEHKYVHRFHYTTIPKFDSVQEAKNEINKIIERQVATKKHEMESKHNRKTKKVHGYP